MIGPGGFMAGPRQSNDNLVERAKQYAAEHGVSVATAYNMIYLAERSTQDDMRDGPELDEDFDPDIDFDGDEFDDIGDAYDPYDIEYDR